MKVCTCPMEPNFDSETIPLDCPATFKMITRSPLGIFQLEGPTARKWLQKFNISSFEEIADFTSLARPGPLESGMMDEYIAVKSGEKSVEYLHPDLEPILGYTKGALIYQEQVMEICKQMAGLSLGDADTVRRAMGKKKADLMAECKKMFTDGFKSNGYEEKLADEIWGWIEKFSGYGFNKAHAVCYAMTAYKTAWLKTHFPTEGFLALLRKSGNSATDQAEEVRSIVNDAKLHGIEIYPPSLQRGNLDFEIIGDKKIAFGMQHIKGIGKAALPEIKRVKDEDYTKFLIKVIKKGLKKTTHEGLIWSGAFDYFNLEMGRFEMASDLLLIQNLTDKELEVAVSALEEGSSLYKAAEGLIDEDVIAARKAINPKFRPPTKRRVESIGELLKEAKTMRNSANYSYMLAREKLLMGITLSGSESDLHSGGYEVDDCIEFVDAKEGRQFRFLCIVEKVREHIDKNKNKMAFVTAGDATYCLDNIVVFARTFKEYGAALSPDKVVVMFGRKNNSSFIVEEVSYLC